MTAKPLEAAYEDLRTWASDPRPRIGTGVPYLDSKMNGGLAKSEIGMVMAFSGVGKTTLGLNAIHRNPSIPVLFFSLEMSGRQVASRLAAMESGHSTAEIEYAYREGKHPPYIQAIVDKFRWLTIDDTPAITLKDAKESYLRTAERLATASAPAPRLVIFDYLELIGGSGLLGKAEQVDKAAEKLRNFARELDTSVIVLHQVGKGDAGGGADQLDLGSGRYGGYAPMDAVWGMWRPGNQKGLDRFSFDTLKEKVVLAVLKNRSTGIVDPQGQDHRIDARSMRLDEWSSTPVIHWQAPKFDYEEAISG